MSLNIILLLLIAAFLNSIWHTLIKASGNGSQAMLSMNKMVFLISTPFIPFFFSDFPSGNLILLILSLFCHLIYKIFLLKIYKISDISYAYPFFKSLTPLLVTILAFFFLKQTLNFQAFCSIALISLSIFILVGEKISFSYKPILFIYIFTLSLSNAFYTILDSYIIKSSSSFFSFGVWLVFLDSLFFLFFSYLVGSVNNFRGFLVINKNYLYTSFSGLLSFFIFLWALTKANVGSVSSLREVGMIFTSLFGVIILKEKFNIYRFLSIILSLLGIIFLYLS